MAGATEAFCCLLSKRCTQRKLGGTRTWLCRNSLFPCKHRNESTASTSAPAADSANRVGSPSQPSTKVREDAQHILARPSDFGTPLVDWLLTTNAHAVALTSAHIKHLRHKEQINAGKGWTAPKQLAALRICMAYIDRNQPSTASGGALVD